LRDSRTNGIVSWVTGLARPSGHQISTPDGW
jgi:hypothetical protein